MPNMALYLKLRALGYGPVQAFKKAQESRK